MPDVHDTWRGGRRAETVYFLRGGKVRIHLPEVDSAEVDLPDEHVMWHEPWTHRVENRDASEIRAIIVESKKRRLVQDLDYDRAASSKHKHPRHKHNMGRAWDTTRMPSD